MSIDVINLSIPNKSQYLLTARLTASTLAVRTNMTIDDTEDLKTVVAESCIMFMQKINFAKINLEFTINENLLECKIEGIDECNCKQPEVENSEFGEFILHAICEDIIINKDNQNNIKSIFFTKAGIETC